MQFIDFFRVCLANLKGNRLRTTLTIIGIAIGIGAIIFLVSLGFGLQKLTVDKIAKSNSLTTLDVTVTKSSLIKLDDQAVEKFSSIKDIEKISPSISLPGQVNLNNTITDCVINGIDPAYMQLQGTKITIGNFLSQIASAENPTPKAIVSTAVLKLFDIKNNQDILDRVIKLDLFIPDQNDVTSDYKKVIKEFKVVGVVDDTSSIVYILVDDLKGLGVNTYNSVKIKATNASAVASIKENITSMGYNVTSIADMVDQINGVFRIFQIVLACFGIIALLVASIGTFNTMTIALLERTKDIGIMRAIGATQEDIRKIFIIESTAIGFLGGVAGVLLGWVLGNIVNYLVNVLAQRAGGEVANLFYYPKEFIFGAIIFSFIIGVITGIYPARRASRINPLDALRYE